MTGDVAHAAYPSKGKLWDCLTSRFMQFIDRGGFTRKQDLIDWIRENARMPAGEYWD